jgi:hypothetical protein
MYLLPFYRDHLLRYLPTSATAAEIGVAEGQFSQQILSTTLPQRLHLIDPWEFQPRIDYAADPNNVPDQENESRYQSVCNTLYREVQNGTVVIQRNYSGDIADEFGNGYFDWIYIDALHTYEGVREDLAHYAPKVKENGLILGHDYTNHPAAQNMHFGVIKAVNEFVRNSDYQLIALTNEAFPTYVLCRSEETKRQFLTSLLLSEKGLVEIRDFPVRPFVHNLIRADDKIVTYDDGTFMHVPSF